MAKSGKGTAIPVNEDIYSPYYFNQSDAYITSGVIKPPLAVDGANYHKWARFFTISIRAMNKLGFLDGTLPAPDSTDEKYPCWIMCDQLILWWIIQSVALELRSNIVYSKSAREAWEKLRVRYSQPDNVRIYHLLKDLRSFSQGSLSVSEYFSRLDGLLEELYSIRPIPVCTCGGLCTCRSVEMAQRVDVDNVFRFLRGLNDAYEDARRVIIGMTPIPTLDRVYAMIRLLEWQRQARTVNTPSNESSVAQVDGRFEVTCEHCKRSTTYGSNNSAANEVKMNSTAETGASARAPSGLHSTQNNIQQQFARFVKSGEY